MMRKIILEDIALLLILFVIFFTNRFLLLFEFSNIDEIPIAWLFASLRFDILIISYIMIPVVCASIYSIALNRDISHIRKLYTTLIIILSIIVCVCDICFVAEYKEQFNFWIWGIFRNDYLAILNEIWRSYPVVIIFIGFVIGTYIIAKITNFIYSSNQPKRHFSIVLSIVISIVYIALLVIGLRGLSFDRAPLKAKDALITNSTFANNIILNPFYCLRIEIENAIKSSLFGGLSIWHVKESDLQFCAKDIFGKSGNDLTKILSKKVTKDNQIKPTRIFFVISESHSAWPIWDEYKNMKLMPESKKIAKRGLTCYRALASGGGTLNSTQSLASGIPHTGLSFGSQVTFEKNFSIPTALKKLGYKCDFYCAASSNWNNLDSYLKLQGFDNIFGFEHLGFKITDREWGMPDRELFSAMLKKGIAENTFNLILTVSNHPPYNIDLKKEGCPFTPKNKAENEFYHFWYADKAIGEFVKMAREKYPDALFIITGDHPSRNYPEGVEMISFANVCVPIIFYGEIIDKQNLVKNIPVGHHLDILPTLLDIIAPKDFEYVSFGNSLLQKNNNNILRANTLASCKGETFFYNNSKDIPQDLGSYKNKLFALSHFLRTKGAILPDSEKK